MGHLAAIDMLEHAGLDQALAWHMQGNLFPPPPSYMTPVARAAIDACNAGDIHASINLLALTGFRVMFRGEGDVQAWQVVEAFRLEAFLDESDDEMGMN